MAARRLEMQFFKMMGVLEKVDRKEVRSSGGKTITTKCVDTDKGHGGYRSRWVGLGLKRDKRLDLYAPTPPLETLKLLVAYCAQSQGTPKPKRIGIFDVSRAYFCAPCQRPIFIEIPDEDWEVRDEHRVGRLNLTLYGTRDAAQNRVVAYTKYLLSPGFEQGRASRCNFQLKGRDIRLIVHGDDFLVVADAEQLAWRDVKLRQQYDMKSEVLAPKRT